MKYTYNYIKDWQEPTEWTSKYGNLIMFLMIIFYSINIYLEDRKNTFDYIMLSIFVLIFILFLINPKLFSIQHHFGKKNIFINISDNVIEWKLDKKHEIVKINIKDIQSISTSTGDVRFKMNDDSIKILKSKNIQNEDKFNEFYQLINTLSGNLKLS